MSEKAPVKRCSTCKQEFLLSPAFFNRDAKRRDGLTNRCKSCATAATRRWQIENKDHVKAIRKHHETTCDKCKARIREWRRKWPGRNAAKKRWYRKNKERVATQTRAYRLRAFGLTPSQYDVMLTDQGGVCAICRNPPEGEHLRVDHDHATGAVRGLLCNHCNLMLGKMNDDPAALRRAADYLERRMPHGIAA